MVGYRHVDIRDHGFITADLCLCSALLGLKAARVKIVNYRIKLQSEEVTRRTFVVEPSNMLQLECLVVVLGHRSGARYSVMEREVIYTAPIVFGRQPDV
jgi:hypothetical protein